jgi:iron complex transport system substrate-binding protein
VVGAVQYSDYPEAAKKLPRVGGYSAVDMEQVIALKPDLVVAWKSGNRNAHLDKLRALGIPVFINEPRRIDDVAKSLAQFGRLAGTDAAGEAAAKAFRARHAALVAKYSARPRLRLFYEAWNRPLMTINGEHLISDVIRLCGGDNVFAKLPVLAPTVDVESVLAAQPEVIVASGMGEGRPEWLDDWRQWTRLPAVARGNLFFIPPDLIQRHTRASSTAPSACAASSKRRGRGDEAPAGALLLAAGPALADEAGPLPASSSPASGRWLRCRPMPARCPAAGAWRRAEAQQRVIDRIEALEARGDKPCRAVEVVDTVQAAPISSKPARSGSITPSSGGPCRPAARPGCMTCGIASSAAPRAWWWPTATPPSSRPSSTRPTGVCANWRRPPGRRGRRRRALAQPAAARRFGAGGQPQRQGWLERRFRAPGRRPPRMDAADRRAGPAAQQTARPGPAPPGRHAGRPRPPLRRARRPRRNPAARGQRQRRGPDLPRLPPGAGHQLRRAGRGEGHRGPDQLYVVQRAWRLPAGKADALVADSRGPRSGGGLSGPGAPVQPGDRSACPARIRAERRRLAGWRPTRP